MVLKIIKILHHSLHVYTLYEWMLALDAWLRNCFETWFWNCSESIQKELYARGRNASISSFIKTNAFESFFFRAKTLHHTFQPFISNVEIISLFWIRKLKLRDIRNWAYGPALWNKFLHTSKSCNFRVVRKMFLNRKY